MIIPNTIIEYMGEIPNNKKDILKDISFLKKQNRIFFRDKSIILITNPIFIKDYNFGRYKVILNSEKELFLDGISAKNIDNNYLHPHIDNKYSYHTKRWNINKYNRCCLNESFYGLLNKGLLVNCLDVIETSLSNINTTSNYFGFRDLDKILDICINSNKYAICISCGGIYLKEFYGRKCDYCCGL